MRYPRFAAVLFCLLLFSAVPLLAQDTPTEEFVWVYADPDPDDEALTIGGQARVSISDGSLELRAEPSASAETVVLMSAGEIVTVLDGPQVVDDLIWWQLETEAGDTGWAVEGFMNGYIPVQALLPLCPYIANRIAWVNPNAIYAHPDEADTARPYQLDNVYTGDAAGGKSCNLTGFARIDSWINELVWSPNGQYLAFAFDDQLYTVSADGRDLRLLHAEPDAGYTSLTWSPDSSQLAYLAWGSGNSQVWVMNADGTEPHALTSAETLKHYLRWSPDGTRLAFIETVWDDAYMGISQIQVIELSSGAFTTVTPDGNADYMSRVFFTVEWDPTSTKLVAGGGYALHYAMEIWIIDLENDLASQLVVPDGEESMTIEAPIWSPDGSTLIYWRGLNETFTYALTGYDGTDFTTLVTDVIRANDYWPPLGIRTEGFVAPISWSSDSKHLTFMKFGEVMTLNLDTLETASIGPYSAMPPAWQPAPAQ